jgi:hypothetical protein
MMMLEGLDLTTIVMVNFAHELMKRNEWLGEELKAQKEARKRSQKMVDDYRESLKSPRMYKKLPRDGLKLVLSFVTVSILQATNAKLLSHFGSNGMLVFT